MVREIHAGEHDTDDPLAGMANFLDLGIIFAAGILLAVLAHLGAPALETVSKRNIPLDRYRVSHEKLGGEGQRLGIAYRLKSGEVVYVPETPVEK